MFSVHTHVTVYLYKQTYSQSHVTYLDDQQHSQLHLSYYNVKAALDDLQSL